MTELDAMQFDGFRSGYVALVGKPNVGKSTLLNHYIGQTIAAVSAKPQTTRRRQMGILNLEKAQVIFVDTPGMHAGNYKLSQFINEEAQYALMDADLILFVVDASHAPEAEDQALAEEIKSLKDSVKVLLVMNKIDQVSPDLLPERHEQYLKLLPFDDVIEISAVTEPGRERLMEKVISLLPEGPRYFPEDQITDIYEREIAGDMIRAVALENLHEEVPYGIFVRVDEYKIRDNNLIYIHATILVERESHKGIVIGNRGAMIKKISTESRMKIEEMSGEKVYLELQVKVEKNWRNNPDFLRRVGLSHD